ncbi:DUF971 domain-containing protein [bacterium]|jgi:DUF971 family protein|nr:DUF971 domain-containing protein [bacterium]
MPNLRKILPEGDLGIRLEFDSGEAVTVPSLELRFRCPCAACVDEITGKRTLLRESLRPDVRPVKIEPVGRYGIHIEWNDGHRTGMYHFDRLYEFATRQT